MSGFLVLAGLIIAFILLIGDYSMFVTILILVLGVYLLVNITKALISFLKEFGQGEWQEVEKAEGSHPSGKVLEDIIDDAGEVLLNKSHPKGNTTKRLAEGAEEFIEKTQKLFRK